MPHRTLADIETLESRLARGDSLTPEDHINLQTELTNLRYHLNCEKKLEAEKARITGLLNVLIGLFAALTVEFFLANRGSGTNDYGSGNGVRLRIL